MPVRLVGLYYRPEKPGGLLIFVFRSIQRGGRLQTSAESLQVGFLDVVPLPRPMLGVHREMVTRALSHDGGPPYWGYQPMPFGVRLLRDLLYGAKDLERALRRRPAFRPPPRWQVGAFVVLSDEQGRVLWVRRRDHDVWNLPGGGRRGMEAPWETAVRETKEQTGLPVKLLQLSGVYTKPANRELLFTFLAKATSGNLQIGDEAAEFAYFAPGEEPPNSLPKHVERVADAAGPQQTTLFREQACSTNRRVP
jgi:ADP-ribose pyrophosphatase YjhB (NUDIX family)